MSSRAGTPRDGQLVGTNDIGGEKALRDLTVERPSGRHRRWPPAAVSAVSMTAVVLVILVLTGLVVQVAHPFIRHDDWGFAVSADEPGATNVWARNLYEGRWLTWLWWRVLGQHLTVVMASAIFVLAYSAWVVGMVRLIRLPIWWHQMLATMALLTSVVWIRLVYWPSTLSPSMVVAAAAVWTLPWARRRTSTWWLWLFLSVGLAVLSYQPVALLLLFAIAVTERDADLRRLVRAVIGFGLAYVLGVLAVWSLNWLAFGSFGVTLSEWRHPNPLHSFGDLVSNLGRYQTQVWSLASGLGVAVVLGAVAAALGLWDRRTRRATGAILVAGVIAVSMEAGLTVLTGTVTGVRASLWAWPLLVIPGAYLLAAKMPGRRRIGVICLVGLTSVGVLQWRQDLDQHQRTRAEYVSLLNQVAVEKQRFPGLPVVLWMEPEIRKTARGNMTAVTVRMMSEDLEGIYPRWCSKVECVQIAATATSPPRGEVFVLNGAIVLRLPSPPAWL